MEQIKMNDQLAVEKVNDHYCVVKTNKDRQQIELCFFTVVDALAYSAERNYL